MTGGTLPDDYVFIQGLVRAVMGGELTFQEAGAQIVATTGRSPRAAYPLLGRAIHNAQQANRGADGKARPRQQRSRRRAMDDTARMTKGPTGKRHERHARAGQIPQSPYRLGDIADDVLVAIAKETYPGLSDPLLWAREARDEIVRRHERLAIDVARRFYMRGAEKDDVVQSAQIGIWNAIVTYDFDRGIPFHAFAKICMTRQISTDIKAANRHKHAPLNESLSLTAEMDTGNTGETVTLENILESPEGLIEDTVIGNDTVQRLTERVYRSLQPHERQVFEMYQAHFSYQEIADKVPEMGGVQKNVDNTIQKVKRIIRRLLGGEEWA